MTREELLRRITTDPAVCHGKPCVRGQRIPIDVILDNLAAGVPEAEIIRAYPSLVVEDVRAAVAFAAEMARVRYVDVAGAGR